MSDPPAGAEQPFQPSQPTEGEPPPGLGETSAQDEPKLQVLAIVGLVVCVVALVFLPIGIGAVLFGFLALQQIGKAPERYRGRGLAIAAIVIGGIEAVLGTLLLVS